MGDPTARQVYGRSRIVSITRAGSVQGVDSDLTPVKSIIHRRQVATAPCTLSLVYCAKLRAVQFNPAHIGGFVVIVPLNEYDFLKRALAVYGDREAIVSGDLRLTYHNSADGSTAGRI